MTEFKNLPSVVRAYVCTVVAAGALVLGLSAQALFKQPPSNEWLILIVLTIFTGSFSVKVTGVNAYISVSEAYVFASVLLFGTETGTVTVLLECLVILFWMAPQGRPTYRAFFNMAAPAVSMWIAGTLLYALFEFKPYSQQFTPLSQLLVPLVSFTGTYFVLNSSLVAIAVGLETKKRSFSIWWGSFAWMSLNYYSGASIAALLVTYSEHLEFSTLMLIGPLQMVSYLTFRTAMGRSQDSNNHLSQLNKLYLSTIETLAMAIDAKDQITHGHIRRVQAYAVGLAQRLDLKDDNLVKAIEAAALLHDMGKLAVPEHILNKPGKLTPAEFEKMKQHAGIGADILSAIEFPYPVVPIVRHHHENWDGTGYPTGIRGTDIPIGARILSVVDCFDALTSDRPYRPKLSDQDALEILIERRGTMYDPLVVDTFVRVYREIAPDSQPAALEHHKGALTEITSSSSLVPPFQSQEQAGVDEPNRLPQDLVHAILDSTKDLGAIVRDVIATTSRADLVVFYRYDGAKDILRAEISSGVLPNLRGVEIGLGERLSGWVAANKRAICNSDPALDLGDVARELKPALRFTLSVPVVNHRDLVGVLTAYRASEFSASERDRFEQIAQIVAERTSEARVATPAVHVQPKSAPVAAVSSFVSVELLNLKQACQVEGSAELLLKRVASEVREHLGANDLLLQNRECEFVALLGRNDAKDVRATAKALRDSMRSLNQGRPEAFKLEFVVETVLAPVDTSTLWDLIATEDHATSTVATVSKVH